MIDELVNSFQLTLRYARRLVADLPETYLAAQPPGVPNHPAWTLGHLAHSMEAIGGELGLEPWLPRDWEARYGTGSSPVPVREAYPSREALLETLEDGAARVVARLREVGTEGLAQPLPHERFRQRFPTVGHAVVHILAAHTALHVGQVSLWRRAAGFATRSELTGD